MADKREKVRLEETVENMIKITIKHGEKRQIILG